MADYNFALQAAQLLKSELDAGRKLNLEFSNEVWNPQFRQNTYAQAQGEIYYPEDPNASWEKGWNWMGVRTRDIIKIFKDEWGVDSSRIMGLAGGQNGSPTPFISSAECTLDPTTPCTSGLDAVAYASYIGGEIGHPDREADVETWDLDRLFLELETVAIPFSLFHLDEAIAVAEGYGLKTVVYEGGQHLTGVGVVKENQTITDLFTAAQRDPRMGYMYEILFAEWKTRNIEIYMHFTDFIAPSKFGDFGLKEYLGQDPTPKSIAVNNF